MTPRRLEYAPRYFRRLEDIRERIAADNPAAAIRMIERIQAAVTRLAGSPALDRPGRVAGTRELVIPRTPYIVPYRVNVMSFRSSPYCTTLSDGRTSSPERMIPSCRARFVQRAQGEQLTGMPLQIHARLIRLYSTGCGSSTPR